MSIEEPAIETEGQLDLFGWERMKLGEGYAALARLDLEAAAAIFSDLQRERPGFPEATEGYAMAVSWSDTLWEAEAQEPETAASFLWERIGACSFGQWGGDLRKALLKKVIFLVLHNPDFYVSPDFCLGSLYFIVSEYEQAETAFKRHLEKRQNDPGLLVRLGNALYRQRRLSEARKCYVQVLLTSPRSLDTAILEDGETAAIVRETGVYAAALYGWLRGVLPLADVADPSPEDENHDSALKIYRIIGQAESARIKRNHNAMVECRRILKETAPEILEEYLARFA